MVVKVYQTFIGCRSHNQEPLGIISAFERYAADRRHEYRLFVVPVNEIRLLLVAFLLPLKPTISKHDSPTMLPERFEHSAGGRGFDARVYQGCFIPPPGRLSGL